MDNRAPLHAEFGGQNVSHHVMWFSKEQVKTDRGENDDVLFVGLPTTCLRNYPQAACQFPCWNVFDIFLDRFRF